MGIHVTNRGTAKRLFPARVIRRYIYKQIHGQTFKVNIHIFASLSDFLLTIQLIVLDCSHPLYQSEPDFSKKGRFEEVRIDTTLNILRETDFHN